MGCGTAPRNPLWVWRDSYRKIILIFPFPPKNLPVRENCLFLLCFSIFVYCDFFGSVLLHLCGGGGLRESWGRKDPAVIAESQVSSCSSIKLEFSYFYFFSCFSPFPFCSSASSTFRVMISPNYAYGNRDLDEIFGLRGTRIHLSVFLMCSLMVISTLNSLNCQECSWQTCGHGCGFRGLCL